MAEPMPIDADALAAAIRREGERSHTEEDLRIGVEALLRPLLHDVGITYTPRYERHYRAVLKGTGGQSDAVYGHAIIEYEPPRTFRTGRGVRHAQGQLERYLKAEARLSAVKTDDVLRRSVGIALDGERIFFVRYRGKGATEAEPEPLLPETQLALLPMEEPPGVFRREGPYEVTTNPVVQFLVYLRALRRRELTPERLADAFGPKGDVAQSTVSALLEAFRTAKDKRVLTLYAEWDRIFGIVYGQEVSKAVRDAKELAELYGVPLDADLKPLLFVVHTYLALLMKLLAAELASLQSGSLLVSPLVDLPSLPSGELHSRLSDLEDGGLFARLGIRNFLEGDFFGWYLSAWTSDIEAAIRDLARTLSEYEPATGSLLPEATRDLLKKLYQYLIPKKIRHDLGEYFTPDWLAELVLNEVGYQGESGVRVLDPACGSGTFLVLAIRKAREAAEERLIEPKAAVEGILSDIAGFDLNPLAVIAARTNYLLALGTLVRHKSPLEIPVYLCDSVLTPSEYEGQLERTFEALGKPYNVPSVVGDFRIPRDFATKERLEGLTGLLEQCVSAPGYDAGSFLERVRGEIAAPDEDSTRILGELFERVASLEKEGRNGIWARILKNRFAPIFTEKADLIVGNPPWVLWGYLADEYRRATRRLWVDYGLFSLKGMAARLGSGEKDFSMLFTYACADAYLKEGGRLGFVITQEVLKAKGKGEGFRRFRLGEQGSYLRVLKAHDMVALKPFEGAANKTAAIVLEKGQETQYPVPYVVWRKRRGAGRLDTSASLADAFDVTEREELEARPVGDRAVNAWQTVSGRAVAALQKLGGKAAYQARLGARVEPYGVFWLSLKAVRADGKLVVENLPEMGKRSIRKIEAAIEPGLVFPAVRGADISRWRARSEVYVVVSQDPTTRQGYPDARMKTEWPETYGYLSNFKDALLSRGSRTVRELAERTVFWSMYGIGEYTFAPYRVVWKRMASDMVATVLASLPTPFGQKLGLPTDTTSLIALENEVEAHFVCALLNSMAVRAYIRSFSSAGRGFGAPSIIEHLALPTFDRNDARHRRLASLSQEAHRLAAQGAAGEEERAGIMGEIEHTDREIDELVYDLYGLTQEERRLVEGEMGR